MLCNVGDHHILMSCWLTRAVIVSMLCVMQNESTGQLGCSHYIKNCMIRAPCCCTATEEEPLPSHAFYPCRLCHDEKEQKHEIDRKTINEMVCMLCMQATLSTIAVQPVSNHCIHCHSQMALYYCDVCKLFDGDPSHDIFHCDKCGICRRGRVDEYFHCDRCGHCMPLTIRHTHPCKLSDALKRACPICQLDMFASREAAHVLPCGHGMHSACYQQLLSNASSAWPVCPLCKKSVLNEAQARQLSSRIDVHVSEFAMPAEYAHWTADVLCNGMTMQCHALLRSVYGAMSAALMYNVVLLACDSLLQIVSYTPQCPSASIIMPVDSVVTITQRW